MRSTRNTKPMTDEDKAKFKAPALVKGLEILELLASESRAFTLSGISDKLERSRSEIFRMVQDLETLGYIKRTSLDDGYEITNKLFTLGLEQPRVTTLLEAALPEMRRYANLVQQSCHLAIPFDDEIVVIARIESPGPISFAVRIGHRRAIYAGTSGIVLLAHQPADVQKEWLALFKAAGHDFNQASLMKEVRKCADDGFLARESNFVEGVTDVGAPVMRGNRAIACFTSPCMMQIHRGHKPELPVKEVIDAAARISLEVTPAA